MIHHGPVPAGMQVCHTCDNKMCVRPDHLWLGTWAENMQDMYSKGRHRSPKRWRLTPKQVDYIRSSDLSNSDLARQLGVSQSLISRIRSGQRR
jgi:ribosome-binding protein aMBF1 (putative translation factor)